MQTNKLLKAAYETYRAQIMLNGVDHEGNLRIDSAYYYAVSVRMYPYFHTYWCDDDLDPFAEIYNITENYINEVVTYVEEQWRNKTTLTFYELEAKFGGREMRSTLIRIFRYCFLNNRFDPDFYAKLLTPMQHPVEAGGLCAKLDLDHQDFLLV